ncbi:pinin [Drosophila takahashii]|uniref:pinin n=1 Tax=Drosophila takahashii TaxID=29030 RepID=UPI0038990698
MRHSGASTSTEFSGHATHGMEQLQPGDACLECQSLGRNHKLRFFYINLEEQLLKCESRSCLWPHNDEVSSDEEQDLVPSNSLSVQESVNLSPRESAPSPEPSPDNDDEFILELLQQLAPATDPPEFSLNLSPEPLEVKPCPEMELPDLSFLEEDIPKQREPSKAVISKQEVTKLKTPPKLKVKQEVAPLKIPSIPSWQGKIEIPLLPASVQTPPKMKPKGDPFSTPPKKASTQPQTQPEAPPAAVNIIISYPELNPAMPFLDAIKRHSTEPKPAARGGGRRTKRLAKETTGRGIRTQAVRHLIEHLEITTEAKLSSPRP